MNTPHDVEKSVPADRGEEGPPFFATWGRLYMAILIYLVLLIVIFFIFQASFT